MRRFVVVICFAVISLFWNTARVSAQFTEAGVQKLEFPVAAPDFSLKKLEGGKISLKELRGKVVILNFFTSWCPVCREEFTSFDQLGEEFKNKHIVFLKVAVKAKGKELEEIRNRFGLSSPTLLDSKGSVAKAYRVLGHHETFFISRAGKIVGKTFGGGHWTSEGMRNLIQHLLAENR